MESNEENMEKKGKEHQGQAKEFWSEEHSQKTWRGRSENSWQAFWAWKSHLGSLNIICSLI